MFSVLHPQPQHNLYLTQESSHHHSLWSPGRHLLASSKRDCQRANIRSSRRRPPLQLQEEEPVVQHGPGGPCWPSPSLLEQAQDRGHVRDPVRGERQDHHTTTAEEYPGEDDNFLVWDCQFSTFSKTFLFRFSLAIILWLENKPIILLYPNSVKIETFS